MEKPARLPKLDRLRKLAHRSKRAFNGRPQRRPAPRSLSHEPFNNLSSPWAGEPQKKKEQNSGAPPPVGGGGGREKRVYTDDGHS